MLSVSAANSAFAASGYHIPFLLSSSPTSSIVFSSNSNNDTFSSLIPFLPPVSSQAAALAALVQHFGWKKIAIVAEVDCTSLETAASLITWLTANSVSVLSYSSFLPPDRIFSSSCSAAAAAASFFSTSTSSSSPFSSEESIAHALSQLQESGAFIIILLATSPSSASAFVDAAVARGTGLTEPPFIWIGMMSEQLLVTI